MLAPQPRTEEQAAANFIKEYAASHTNRFIKSIDGTRIPVTTTWEQMTGQAGSNAKTSRAAALPPPTGPAGPKIARTPLVKANRKADFLYYPSSTFGFNHGHSALYARKGRLVEAANARIGVRSIAVADRSVPKNQTHLLKLTFASGQVLLDAMANYADGWVGSAYRGWAIPNRTTNAPYNCSQLVWAVYRLQGWDLDNGGGTYVFPIDVATADGVRSYKKI